MLCEAYCPMSREGRLARTFLKIREDALLLMTIVCGKELCGQEVLTIENVIRIVSQARMAAVGSL